MNKGKKVLLLGSYGQTNLGDDLLMFNYLAYLRAQGFDEIMVNANTTEHIPGAIKNEFKHLKILGTYQTSLFQWMNVLRQVDSVVYGGGTVYKELYGSTGRNKYGVISRLAVFNVLARLFGARVHHLNIGIGSLKTKLGKLITKVALWPSELIIFRDQQSYDFAVKRLRLAPNKLCSGTDGLFLNDQWQRPWKSEPLGIPRGKYKAVVGVNVLSDIPDWIDRDEYIKTLRKSLKMLLEQKNFVVFLPFQYAFNPRSDLAFLEKEILPYLKDYKNFRVIEQLQIDTIQGYLQQLDVFVGMRFHSLLLATALAKPFLAIAYDTKCWRFTKEWQYPYAIKLEELTSANLMEMFDALLKDKETTSDMLESIAASNYEKALSCRADVMS